MKLRPRTSAEWRERKDALERELLGRVSLLQYVNAGEPFPSPRHPDVELWGRMPLGALTQDLRGLRVAICRAISYYPDPVWYLGPDGLPVPHYERPLP